MAQKKRGGEEPDMEGIRLAHLRPRYRPAKGDQDDLIRRKKAFVRFFRNALTGDFKWLIFWAFRHSANIFVRHLLI